MAAGNAAGVPVIGFANKPGKSERLQSAGAVAIIISLSALLDLFLGSMS